MTPSGIWNRERVRVKSIMTGLVRGAQILARRLVVSRSEIIHLKDFLTVPWADDVSRLPRSGESSQEPNPHALSSDFRLERRLRQRPQHSRRRTLAGGLGATRPSLSR